MGFLQAQSLCPGLGLSPKYTDQLGCQQKSTHFCYNIYLIAFAQSFKKEAFDKLAINALSAITPEIESDHKHTCVFETEERFKPSD